jgi:hypothetical protein
MVHSNYIDSFAHIAKGIYKLDIQVPPVERELVNTFGQSYYGQFLHMTETHDLIGIVSVPIKCISIICHHYQNILKLCLIFSLPTQIVQFLNFQSVKAACDRIHEFYVPDNTP